MYDETMHIPKPDASVTDLVVSKVREAIAMGNLVAGQKLTERELMERTGVSRTSVRESLRHLQATGLVEQVPGGRGLIIPALDRQAVEHIYEVRAAIEPVALRLFTLSATDEQIARYADWLTGSAPSTGGWGMSTNADHLVLEVVGNPHFSRLMEPLYARIQPLRVRSASTPGRAEIATAEVAAVLTAVRGRRPVEAEEAARKHVEAARESALRVVDLDAEKSIRTWAVATRS